VVLPALTEKAVPEIPASMVAPGGAERILVVDDEAMLAEMTMTLLKRLGYTVTVRTSSWDALDLFRQAPQSFDMVITDQTMPQMTGIELAQAMLAIRPQLPIILCTGYSNKISENKIKACGIKGLLMKPFSRNNIADLIRRILNEETDKKKLYLQ
jgi:CheY-like chemotaxis protein